MATGGEEETQGGHWVEGLFPPAYGVTLDDVLEGKMPDDDGYSEPKKITRVTPLNPDSIKHVYEKVRLAMVIGDKLKEQEERRNPTQTDNVLGEEIDKAKRVDGVILEEGPINRLGFDNKCIWDSDEIDVLRKVYKSAQGEITQLNIRLRESETKNEKLEKQIKSLDLDFKKSISQLSEAKKANRRLKIHCDSLKEEVGINCSKVDTLQQVLDEIKKEQSKTLTELHNTRLEGDKIRLKYKTLQLKSDNLQDKYAAEQAVAVENMKLSFQQEILDLEKKVAGLILELEKEKNKHSVTKKGLEQLQRHFASLPQPGGFPNAVSKDEIKRFQY